QPDPTPTRASAAYRNLTLILQQAAEHRIPVTLYIHPYHARFLNMLSEVGLWQSFEEWKRVIVNTVGDIVTGTLADTRIFDFSGFNEFAVEPVPPQGDRHTVMRWYWEPGHYKSALGERILARIFHEEGPFGYVLSSENIESVLSKIRGERIRLIGQSATKF